MKGPFLEQPRVEFRDITLKMDDGQELTAPIGYWVIAMMSVMTTKQQTSIKERIFNMLGHETKIYIPKPMSNGELPNSVSVDAKGKRHFKLNAEPGHYDFSGKGKP